MNDGISKDISGSTYVSVNDVVAGIVQQGRGTVLVKMDIRQAHHNVPIHVNDRPWACNGRGYTFVDAALLFRLRSVPLTGLLGNHRYVAMGRGEDGYRVGGPHH